MPTPRDRPSHATPARTAFARHPRIPFLVGLGTGVAATLAIVSALAVGTLSYMQTQANLTTSFAMGSVEANNSGRVELYFPLEKFLAWRSTHQLTLGMKGNDVHIRMRIQPFQQFAFHFTVDIFGKPGVSHGYFSLSDITGYVDHIPMPKSLILGAIAGDGGKYGIHVDEQRDTLYVEKSFGAYRLVGYDRETKDLVISLPVQTVERAARDRQIM